MREHGVYLTLAAKESYNKIKFHVTDLVKTTFWRIPLSHGRNSYVFRVGGITHPFPLIS